MQTTEYKRVDVETLERQRQDQWRQEQTAATPAPADAAAATPTPRANYVRWSIIPISVALCIAQSLITIAASNRTGGGVILTSTMITVLSFGVLFGLVLVINPLLRLMFRGKFLKPFSSPELICVFAAMVVTSGVSTFGLTEQLVPMLATPYNPEWNTPQRGWSEKLIPNLNASLYITDTEAIRIYREGVNPVDAHGQAIPRPTDSAPLMEKVAYYGHVFRAIPWGTWIKPLSFWLLFVAAAYGMFFCLSHVVLGNWSKREKLIFPLAKLPESLLPEPGSHGWIPQIFRSWGFWAGFLVSFCVLTYNASISAKWITGMDKLVLGMSRGTVNTIIQGSVFDGLQYGLMFLVIFTAIGIAFLLPLEISFSVWFYYLIGRFMLLVSTWMGHGKDVRDMPADWLWASNHVTAQGAGAMLCFSAFSLYRSMKDYLALAKGKGEQQRFTLLLPVIGLGVCLAVIVGWLMWNKIGFIWALGLAAFLTLITLGFMRIVAEGGIYWFQNFGGSAFHMYKMLGLGGLPSLGFGALKLQALTPVLVGPLLPIYSVLFLDIKTFLAPNLLNSAKMYEDVPQGRARFHLNLITCLIVSVVVSLGFAIFLAHLKGAQQMHGWFYSSGPQWIMDLSYNATSDQPAFDPTITSWTLFGVVWVALSMFLRRTLFWFPHPIGYVMLVNPLMDSLWFSFFIGWMCKKTVVKYGGKATFDKTRVIFIGLIMGELLAVCIYPLASLIMGFSASGIDLNRYGP